MILSKKTIREGEQKISVGFALFPVRLFNRTGSFGWVWLEPYSEAYTYRGHVFGWVLTSRMRGDWITKI